MSLIFLTNLKDLNLRAQEVQEKLISLKDHLQYFLKIRNTPEP